MESHRLDLTPKKKSSHIIEGIFLAENKKLHYNQDNTLLELKEEKNCCSFYSNQGKTVKDR